MTWADLPLLSQFWTASRLNVASNLRRALTGVSFMGLMVHCSPNSPSVNSKQPQRNPHASKLLSQIFQRQPHLWGPPSPRPALPSHPRSNEELWDCLVPPVSI